MIKRRASSFGPVQTLWLRPMWLRLGRPIKRAGVVGTILSGAALSLYAAAQMLTIRLAGLQ